MPVIKVGERRGQSERRIVVLLLPLAATSSAAGGGVSRQLQTFINSLCSLSAFSDIKLQLQRGAGELVPLDHGLVGTRSRREGCRRLQLLGGAV
jgi:hypothetical protein